MATATATVNGENDSHDTFQGNDRTSELNHTKMAVLEVKNYGNGKFQHEGPCFFKIILPGLTTEELRIPPHFMKHIREEMSDKATLNGPSGGHWYTKLGQKENGTYLQDGWQEFLKDHSIGEAVFLLFRYDGNLCFNVQIFDKSGLERIYTSDTRKQRDANSTSGKRKRGRPKKRNVSPLKLHQLKSSRYGPGEHPPCPESNKHTQSEKEKGEGTQRKTRSCEKTDKSVLIILDPESQPKGYEEEKDAHRKRKTSKAHKRSKLRRMRPPTEEEVDRAWERSESFTSKFPYYKCCLEEFHVREKFILPISQPFTQPFFPTFKTEIILRNSKGHGWIVNLVPVSQRPSFSRGWRVFVLDNKLKQGDVCIFELAREGEMQVHIFRWMPKVESSASESD